MAKPTPKLRGSTPVVRSIQLPASFVKVASDYAISAPGLQERLRGFVEGRGASLQHEWRLIITGARLQRVEKPEEKPARPARKPAAEPK